MLNTPVTLKVTRRAFPGRCRGPEFRALEETDQRRKGPGHGDFGRGDYLHGLQTMLNTLTFSKV